MSFWFCCAERTNERKKLPTRIYQRNTAYLFHLFNLSVAYIYAQSVSIHLSFAPSIPGRLFHILSKYRSKFDGKISICLERETFQFDEENDESNNDNNSITTNDAYFFLYRNSDLHLIDTMRWICMLCGWIKRRRRLRFWNLNSESHWHEAATFCAQMHTRTHSPHPRTTHILCAHSRLRRSEETTEKRREEKRKTQAHTWKCSKPHN